jgi:uncharacterized membrane protein
MGNPRRSMCATMLALQCIVLGLSTPVLITIADVDTATSLTIGLGLAALSLAVAGLLRYEWAYYAGFAIQAATLALGFVVPVMFVLGVVFGSLYAAAYLLGRKIESDRAAWGDRAHQDPSSGSS